MTPGSANAFNAASNRLNPAVMVGYGYDAVGNVTSDPTTLANGIVYDAENRQVSYTKAGVTTSYSYDGDGRRVKKVTSGSPTVTTVYMYDVMGHLIAEYTDSSQPQGSGTKYVTADHLGSTRVVTGQDQRVKARYDYLPFGEEMGANVGLRTAPMGYSATENTRQKFTAKERDSESGLDYFLARYYSSAQGRFSSVDPENAGADSDDAQSWNGYAYARSNPVLYSDPDGQKYLIRGPNGYGFMSDEEFYRERSRFNPDNRLSFTGNRDWYESGDILGPDGEWLASYQQVSIDDRAQELAYEMRESFRDPATYRRAAINTIIGVVINRAISRGPAPALKGDPYHPDMSSGSNPIGKRAREVWPALQKKMNSVERAAERLGYTKEVKGAPFKSHGQKVFTDGSGRYITHDIDSHSGGAWKMFDRQGNRLGTYDANLKRIGD